MGWKGDCGMGGVGCGMEGGLWDGRGGLWDGRGIVEWGEGGMEGGLWDGGIVGWVWGTCPSYLQMHLSMPCLPMYVLHMLPYMVYGFGEGGCGERSPSQLAIFGCGGPANLPTTAGQHTVATVGF